MKIEDIKACKRCHYNYAGLCSHALNATEEIAGQWLLMGDDTVIDVKKYRVGCVVPVISCREVRLSKDERKCGLVARWFEPKKKEQNENTR